MAQFVHTRNWEAIEREDQEKRKAERVNLMSADANPDPNYRKPHHLLLDRTSKTK
jgi:hypothetical protein